jgi:RNA polymerase sigma-70 factor, ECF subfamily
MATLTASDVTSKHLPQDFENIFRCHYQLVYRTAFSVTGSPEDAEDVLQTIFLRLLRREFPPDLDKDPRAYLYRAAVNASLDMLRFRRRQVPIDDADAFQEAYQVGGASDEHLQGRLLDAISRLKPKAVEILFLKYVHHHKEVEIAKMMGSSRGAIALSLFRSRARIRKLMGACSGEKS